MQSARNAMNSRVGLVAVVGTLVIWGLMSGSAMADVHIRTVQSVLGVEGAQDVLVKQSRTRVIMPDGSGQIFFCATGELVVLTPPEDGRYWQGSLEEYATLIQETIDQAFAQVPPEAAAFFSFDQTGQTGTADVRITRVGGDSIAGYAATEYLIEYNDGSGWQTYQNIWLSEELMGEIQ